MEQPQHQESHQTSCAHPVRTSPGEVCSTVPPGGPSSCGQRGCSQLHTQHWHSPARPLRQQRRNTKPRAHGGLD